MLASAGFVQDTPGARPVAPDPTMRRLDSRRLTGPNFHIAGPAAIAEVVFEPGDEPEALLAAWRRAVSAALTLLDWPIDLAVRHYTGPDGQTHADLVFAAPEQALLLATDINDWAVAAATRVADGHPQPDPADELELWREDLARVHDPALDALRTAAAARDLPVLLDEERVSVGHGRHGLTWPIDQVPAIDAVPWASLRRIPVALITGTNGKTTTARVLARIARIAGRVPGNTSTDGMSVDERMIEAGDWTGPGAARTVLRHPAVELAVLEVARGGILRRGLAIDRCDAAVVTNISPDHMGDYGIHDLAAMARVKAVVGSVVAASGRVILGADSPPLVELVRAGHRFPAPIVWFALRGAHPTIVAHRADQGEAWFVTDDGMIVHARGAHEEPLVSVRELPFCFGGAALHNVANALAAAAAAHTLGLPAQAIADGLRAFTSSPADNPGRANVARVGEVTVLLDFAHNPAGIRSLASLLAALRGPHRMMVATGMAGDRRDEDIHEAARAIHEMHPTEVRLRDLEHYLRGRKLGDVPKLMRQTLTALGTPAAAIRDVETEMQVLREGLKWAQPGDLIAILDHVERDEIQAELARLGAVPYTHGP